jgi:cell division protein FtsN
MMVDRIKKETLIKNLRIVRLSETNYRVLIGPFNDIKSLRDSFEKMSSFNFENLQILKNV